MKRQLTVKRWKVRVQKNQRLFMIRNFPHLPRMPQKEWVVNNGKGIFAPVYDWEILQYMERWKLAKSPRMLVSNQETNSEDANRLAEQSGNIPLVVGLENLWAAPSANQRVG